MTYISLIINNVHAAVLFTLASPNSLDNLPYFHEVAKVSSKVGQHGLINSSTLKNNVFFIYFRRLTKDALYICNLEHLLKRKWPLMPTG